MDVQLAYMPVPRKPLAPRVPLASLARTLIQLAAILILLVALPLAAATQPNFLIILAERLHIQ
jgi:hypothetical protein